MTIFNAIKPLLTEVLTNVPMSEHTSFRIGGNADVLAMPETTDELINIFKTCNENDIPLVVLGDGANVLVSDDGIRGVVVFTKNMNKIQVVENKIHAQAGVRLTALAEAACNAGLAGFEFASGIPGTVGGAIYMNAGAYNHDISEFCQSVTLFDNGIVKKSNVEMEFGYRKSYAQTGDMLILKAVFNLSEGKTEEIRKKIQDLNARRRKSQPLEYHSAGSFFKRPEGEGLYAGKLIQDSALKGYRVGDAQVSEKHAGFVINRGKASAKDVLALMHHVQETVFEKCGVRLEPEVRIL
jgi:UDP-N-acetylmuramate dehydrogenase